MADLNWLLPMGNLVLIHRTALRGRYSMISSILQIGKLSLWRDVSNSIYLRMDRTRAKTKPCLPGSCTLVSSGLGSPVGCVCIFSASSFITAWQQRSRPGLNGKRCCLWRRAPLLRNFQNRCFKTTLINSLKTSPNAVTSGVGSAWREHFSPLTSVRFFFPSVLRI